MKHIFKERPFLILLFFYLLSFGFLIIKFPKGELELYLNQFCNIEFDYFFKYYTHVGDGWFYTFFVFVLIFIRLDFAFFATFAISFSTIIVQTLKNTLFYKWPRPVRFLPKETILHFVEGVEINQFNTFPSGHTATAFCMAGVIFFISFNIKNSFWKILLQVFAFFAAFFVGISRVYLMQHFVIDTFFGTIFGFLAALLAYFIFVLPIKKSENWLKKPLYKLIFN